MNSKIDLIYIDAGGGHRAAATALTEVARQQQRPWDLRPLCIQELLDSIDFIRKTTGIQFQDVYNIMLRRGWTLGTAQLIPLMHLVIRMFHKEQVEVLERHWAQNRPDLVVSLIPHYNRAICEALDRAWPGTPLVTILTDIADYPPHFWIERQDQHFICGSDKAVEQALDMGRPASKVHRVSGMILNPRFYEIAPLTPQERAAARAQLGFRPELPVGLVLFGGEGSAVMLEIARSLQDRQLLLICGKNEKLRARLQALPRLSPHRAAMFVEGFTVEVPRYMQLADYFIGKPGPGSLSEAVAMHLPCIVERNAWTLPQERYNSEWLRKQGAGIVLPNFRGIREAANELLDPPAYARFRAATERMRNRAVFEIPEILERILMDGN